MPGLVTEDELADLSLACQRLWDLDVNRLTPGREYEINVQRGRRFGDSRDAARDPLFKRVDPEVFERPTYEAFLRLTDNYEAATGVDETTTSEERRETWAFLDAVLDTEVMRYAHEYAARRRRADPDLPDFRQQLFQMWFSAYRRDGRADSSGFEHVFLGERDHGEVKGFHNWIYFYREEQKGRVDYRGYVAPRYRAPGTSVDNDDQMLSVNFTWQGQGKSVTTLFVGTSPEFELALYTLVFLVGQERNRVEIDRYNLTIRAFRIQSRAGAKVGAVFPELESEDAA